MLLLNDEVIERRGTARWTHNAEDRSVPGLTPVAKDHRVLDHESRGAV